MKGRVGYDKKTRRYYVSWYDEYTKKSYKIWFFEGIKMYDPRHADQLLGAMRADYKRRGTAFRIQKWTQRKSDVGEFLWKWIELLKPNLARSTYQDWKGHIKNHFEPFFSERNLDLCEIDYSLLVQFVNQLSLSGSSKLTILSALKVAFRQAKRDGLIEVIPEFPEKRKFNIVKKVPQWLPEERQLNVIHCMPYYHQPIFAWCKYHLRRPSEGMALYKADFDSEIYYIQRGFSGGQFVDYTKTRRVYPTPCAEDFKPYIRQMARSFSPFYFINPEAKTKNKHYGPTAMRNILIKALRKANEPDIPLYNFLKHSSITQKSHAGVPDADLALAADIDIRTVKHYRVAAEMQKKKEVLNLCVKSPWKIKSK